MSARLAAAAITAFWLVMMSLLVWTEYFPQHSALAAVPIEHIWRLVFEYRQPSFLSIVADGRHAGSVSLRPDVSADGERRLDFSGTYALQPDPRTRDRIFWNGTLRLSRELAVTHLALSASLNNPPWHLDLEVDPVAHRMTSRVTAGGEVVQQWSGDPADFFASILRMPELAALGLNPAAISGWQQQLGTPSFRAVHGKVRTGNGDVPGYAVTLEHGAGLHSTIFVSQLGQVLTAETPFGFRLAAEDVMP